MLSDKLKSFKGTKNSDSEIFLGKDVREERDDMKKSSGIFYENIYLQASTLSLAFQHHRLHIYERELS